MHFSKTAVVLAALSLSVLVGQSRASSLLGLNLQYPDVVAYNVSVSYDPVTYDFTATGTFDEVVLSPGSGNVRGISESVVLDSSNVYSLNIKVDNSGNLMNSTGSLSIVGTIIDPVTHQTGATPTTFAYSNNIAAFGYSDDIGEFDFIFKDSTGALGHVVDVQLFDFGFVGLPYDFTSAISTNAKSDNYAPSAVPLPAASWLGGAGLALLVLGRGMWQRMRRDSVRSA